VGLIVLFGLLGWSTNPSFHNMLLCFVLAIIVGYNIVWSVTSALHTPLMSVTNAISGIIFIGCMLQLHGSVHDPNVIIALFGIFFAAINISGGFIVTHKMLTMFTK
jgi:NAD(P) transhydrogenase subunit alpha